MTQTQIEGWAMRIVESVLAKSKKEGDNVELKSEWPQRNPVKTAKQIGALANRAHGETALWIIGVDENNHCLTTYEQVEVSTWWSAIRSRFDDKFPAMQTVPFKLNGQDLVALAFGTESAPYVVRLDDNNLCVPWRQANGTETISRSQLMRILSPPEPTPDYEIIGASFTSNCSIERHCTGQLIMSLYVIPQNQTRISFPFHKQYVMFSQNDGIELPLFNLQIAGALKRETRNTVKSATIVDSSTEILVDGPGLIKINAAGDIPYLPVDSSTVTATAYMKTAGRDSQRIGATVVMPYRSGDQYARQWTYGSPRPWQY